MENKLYINYCGTGSPATENWRLNKDAEIQRFYYILGGAGWYRSANGEKHMFEKGCVYVFPYNIRHSFHTDMSDPIRHLYFDFFSSPPIIASTPLCIPVTEGSELGLALELACRMLASRKGAPCTKTQRHLLGLLLDLADEQSTIPFNTDEVICRTLKTVGENFDKQITVTDLAKEAGFEVNYFIRRFSRVMKQTPYAYLKNYRLMQAENLLSEGIPAEKVAEQVGYDSVSSLTRALRRSGQTFK